MTSLRSEIKIGACFRHVLSLHVDIEAAASYVTFFMNDLMLGYYVIGNRKIISSFINVILAYLVPYYAMLNNLNYTFTFFPTQKTIDT